MSTCLPLNRTRRFRLSGDGRDSERVSDFEAVPFANWAPLIGRWELGEDSAVYLPPGPDDPAHGLLLSPAYLSTGAVRCQVRFPADEAEAQGRIVIGYDGETQAHYSAGLGGWRALYSVEGGSVAQPTGADPEPVRAAPRTPHPTYAPAGESALAIGISADA